MKLSALKGKEQRVTIQVPSDQEGSPDEEIEVVYRPGVLTIDVFEKVSSLEKSGGDVSVVAELLANVLVSWELEDEVEVEQPDGTKATVVKPLGVSMEEIRKVPVPFLGQILEKITEAVTPTPQRGGTSEEASPQEAPQERSLSGIS